MVRPFPGIRWVAMLLLLFLFYGCSQGDDSPTPLDPPRPEGFVAMLQPADNPLTVEGVSLGKTLFFDPGLSADGSVSCATCHQPALAFTDGRRVSEGVYGRTGSRNAPSLLNVGFYYRGLFWDGRVRTLEEQVVHPLSNPNEMGGDWDDILAYLRRHANYSKAFGEAFGDKGITREGVAWALAQYLRTLVSADARFDRVMRGEAKFTAAEQRGWAIFFDATDSLPHGECAHCHADPLFTTLEFQNIGLDAPEKIKDPGREQITGRPSDYGRFRVPALRNVARTAPYMHDGRFTTLEEVVEHYISGGEAGYNVSPNVRPLQLNESQKADLIAFLQTLTDTSGVSKDDSYATRPKPRLSRR